MPGSIFPELLGRRKRERGDTELNRYMGRYLMGNEKEVQKAKETIKRVQYLTLATSGRNAVPWCNPLFCAYDKDYTFYWISSRHCVHSANIKENSDVTFVIYDSTVPEGYGFGVYIKAKAEMVNDPKEIEKGLKLLYSRKKKTVPRTELFVGDTPRKVYKAVLLASWINDIASKEEELKNIRTEIVLR